MSSARTRKRILSSPLPLVPFKKRKFTTVSSYRGLAVGPLTLKRKLRYATSVTINPASGASLNVFIRANGMFDPEVAVGGHQPMGFDQYMAMYDHFKVDSFSISVSLLATTANVVSQFIASVSVDDDAVANTSMTNIVEQGLATWRVGNVGSGNDVVRMKQNFNSDKFFANRKTAGVLVGDIAADPTEEAFFNIAVGPMDGVSDVEPVKCFIVVDYNCTFSERKTLISS